MESRGFDLVVRSMGPVIGKIGGDPAIHVAWREIRMSSWLGLRGILWISCAAMAAAIPLWAFTWESWSSLAAHQAAVGAELYLAGLGATVISASSIVRERESKSMEILLAAPVHSRSVTWGKFWALALAFWVLLLPPFEHLLCFAATGRLAAWTPVAFLLVAPSAIACFVAIGLFISSWATRLVTAQVLGLVVFHACVFGGLACPCLNFLVPPASIAPFTLYGIAPGYLLENHYPLMRAPLPMPAVAVFTVGAVGLAVSVALVGWLVQNAGERFRELSRRR